MSSGLPQKIQLPCSRVQIYPLEAKQETSEGSRLKELQHALMALKGLTPYWSGGGGWGNKIDN